MSSEAVFGLYEDHDPTGKLTDLHCVSERTFERGEERRASGVKKNEKK